MDWEEIAGYARAARIGDRILVCGPTATGPDGDVVGTNDPAAQARFIFDSPLILERLGLTLTEFQPIKQAAMVENDMDKACELVDERMLKIGVVGRPKALITRLEPLVEAGARHLSFGPPLGPDLKTAIALLGYHVLPYFK